MNFLEIKRHWPETEPQIPPPQILVIAGWDPTAGAGIAADLKTANQLHTYACAVPTALTVQNRSGIREILPVPNSNFKRQLSAILEENRFPVWKLGMLGSIEQLEIISQLLKKSPPRHLIIDPVISATFGGKLTTEGLRKAVAELLFPHRPIVTPNLYEAEILAGPPPPNSPIQRELPSALSSAKKILEKGPQAVVITGIPSKDSDEREKTIDLLWSQEEGAALLGPKLHLSQEAHGTGCTYASALSSFLAWGFPLLEAARLAKAYLLLLLERFSQLPPLPANSLQHLPFYNWREYAKKIEVTDLKTLDTRSGP